jgi:glycosyltransferase involved in cell wall biosynthesis
LSIRFGSFGKRPKASASDSGVNRGGHRVLVVGAGTRFLSAMSYYTIRVTNALAEQFPVAAIPMRQLIPTFLYPGRSRIHQTTTQLTYDRSVVEFDGVDWFWLPNLIRDCRRLVRWKPEFVVFQWWTGAVLHTYLAIACVARLTGSKCIVEFHEVQDTGEARIPLARGWVSMLGRPFFALASAFVIHSESDRAVIERKYRVGSRPCEVILHGPLDHHAARESAVVTPAVVTRAAPTAAFNLLFFGLIRPYKGLEDLVQAFDDIDETEIEDYWLTVVGETWEGWNLPIEKIAESRYRDRITLVNRFVDDAEVIAHFAQADGVVLPYHRSSASSPAHVAMSNGLPLVITEVGGLPEAVADYKGAVLVPPHDPTALKEAIRLLPGLRGQRFEDPHTWDRTVDSYRDLFDRLACTERRPVSPE